VAEGEGDDQLEQPRQAEMKAAGAPDAERSARGEAEDAGGRHELGEGDQQPGEPDSERGQRAPARPMALQGDQQQRDDA